MKWSNGMRQCHCWLSILFTLTVVGNFAVGAVMKIPGLLIYLPLPFLVLLLFTGLYMFALPYVKRRRVPVRP